MLRHKKFFFTSMVNECTIITGVVVCSSEIMFTL